MSGTLPPSPTTDNVYLRVIAENSYSIAQGGGGGGSWPVTNTPAVVTALGALANAVGWLYNDGAGTLIWSTPSLGGAAGGVLGGTYPNPSFANIAAYSLWSNNTAGAAAPSVVQQLTLGTPGFSPGGYNAIQITVPSGTQGNGDAQIIIQGQNAGNAAQSEFSAAADNATASTHFVELGINSSGNNTGTFPTGANLGYVMSISDDFYVGTVGNNNLKLFANSATVLTFGALTGATFTPAARSGVAAAYLAFSGVTDTAIPANTEAVGISHQASTKTWVDGTVASQREYLFLAPTYNKTTTSATFTKAGTLVVSDAPQPGSGVTITNPRSLWVQAGVSEFDAAITGSVSGLSLNQVARTSGTSSYLTVTIPADTGISTATESVGINLVAGTRTWVDGTVAQQREVLFQAPTYNKTTTSATFTKAATVAITAAPVAGSGVTITNGYAFWVIAGKSQFDGLIAAGAGVVASGAVSNDFSGSSGTFLTSTGANQLSGAVTVTDATTPSITLATGKTNTGFFLVNGKTSGGLKINAVDAAAQTVTLQLAAQTTGAATLTLPDCTGAARTVPYLERANTFSGAQTFSGGIAASGANANDWSGGSGTFKTSTGAVTIGTGAVGVTGPLTVTATNATTAVTITQTARTSGVLPYIKYTIPTDTAQTASTESPGIQGVTGTRQWATTGTVGLQREIFFPGPTYTSVSASQTFTEVFNMYLTPPVAGSNAIFTRGHTLGIVDSTSAGSSITGGLVVATTLGTAATSVGIGGGNVFAGGQVVSGVAGSPAFGINGLSGAVTSSTRLLKTVGSIADNTATSVLTVTIPNAAHSATLWVTLVGSLGAGGAIGANEATGTVSYAFAITRTAGVNATTTISSVSGSAMTNVSGGATITVSAVASSVSGAVGATNSFTVNVTIQHGSGSSTNHTCLVDAELINANASGVTIA